MLQRLKNEYVNYFNTLHTTYAERIAPLEGVAHSHFIRFADNTLPLFVEDGTRIRRVTLRKITDELVMACKRGIPFVEYTTNFLLYQGWEGDNVHMFTGFYHIQPESIRIPGSHSLLTILRKTFEGLTVTFTEKTSTSGLLRIELTIV